MLGLRKVFTARVGALLPAVFSSEALAWHTFLYAGVAVLLGYRPRHAPQGMKACFLFPVSRSRPPVLVPSQKVTDALTAEEPLAPHGTWATYTHRLNLAFTCK
jgi:hypothetical protein